MKISSNNSPRDIAWNLVGLLIVNHSKHIRQLKPGTINHLTRKPLLQIRSDLNVVSDKVTLSDAFADVEPEEHLSADQRVQPGIAHRQVLPVSGLGAADQLADAFTDGRNVAGLRWGELDGSVLQESLEFRATLGQQIYRWSDCDERGESWDGDGERPRQG